MQGQFYNRYNTPLSPEERNGLYEYLMELSLQTRRNAYNDLNDYDMAGAYLAGDVANGGGHFPDTYKKPNHPTFSDESQYHGTDGYAGGHWTESTFIPSEWNLENMPPEQMRQYFESVEPDIELILPERQDGGNDMAVIYAPKQSGGGIGSGLGIVGTLLSFVPGMQGVGQGVSALGAAANGNYAGAAKSLAGLGGGGTDAAANAATNAAANTVTPQLRSSSMSGLQSMFQDYNRRNR